MNQIWIMLTILNPCHTLYWCIDAHYIPGLTDEAFIIHVGLQPHQTCSDLYATQKGWPIFCRLSDGNCPFFCRCALSVLYYFCRGASLKCLNSDITGIQHAECKHGKVFYLTLL